MPELSTYLSGLYSTRICDKCDFEEVAYLVLHGELPNKNQLKNLLKMKDQKKTFKTNFKRYQKMPRMLIQWMSLEHV